MSEPMKNASLLVSRPNSDRVMLVVAMVREESSLDVEGMLAALVPEMAKGEVRGGLLVVGDSALVLRYTGQEVLVDEVDTAELLALAGIEEAWTQENLPRLMSRWIAEMAETWRDRLEGTLHDLLVPHLVAGLRGDLQLVEGIWGTRANRVASELPPTA